MQNRTRTESEDRRINRRAMYAQWAMAIGMIIALALSGYSTCISRQASEDATKALEQDNLRISYATRMTDFQTTITEILIPNNGEMESTGVLTIYWEFIISNNGANDAWLVEYSLRSLRETYPTNYPGMERGLFLIKDGNLVSTNIPVLITSGNTVVLYAGIGLLMDSGSYRLILEHFKEEDSYTIREVNEYLGTKGVDLYGNPVEAVIPGTLTYTSPDEVKEQWFITNFETSRGLVKARFISWYTHSGIPEGRVQ